MLDENSIKDKIYEIRGEKVMLDFELAELYGYSTKAFNQQVSRNGERFDDDFYFQLTKDEYENLRSQNVTSSWGGHRWMPYAFTEQGIYMLMTVLKGDLAVQQSKALVRMFKNMKDFLVEYKVDDSSEMMKAMSEKVGDILTGQTEMKTIIKNFIGDNEEKFLANGKYTDADIIYKEIYESAEKTIFIIDNYIGLKTLILLKDIKSDVKCTVFSDNVGMGLHAVELEDFRRQYPSVHLRFKEQGRKIHDRFIVIDYDTENEKFYHCGGSSKDSGRKNMVVARLRKTEDVRAMVKRLINNKNMKIV